MSLKPLNLNENPKKKEHVHFDEATIEEHDKERGTRMIIDEPDTPFARSPLVSESEDDSMSRVTQFNLDAASVTSGRSEDEHAAFKARRKAHYNEFKVVKSQMSDSQL